MTTTGVGAGIGDFVEVFNDGDADAVRSLIGREFFSYRPGPGEPGADDVLHGLAVDLRRAMSDLAVAVDGIEEAGDELRATMTLSGTHDGPLWGVPPTRRHVTWSAGVRLRRAGDRFALTLEGVEVPAILGVLRELEVVPPPDKMDRPTQHPVEFPEILLRLVFTGQIADKPCAHVDAIRVTEPRTSECAQCVATGDVWPALRMCVTCGFVGCCDTSRNKHMKAHHEETGHPLFRSIRMRERWMWCYEDNAFFGANRLVAAGGSSA